MGAAIYSVTVGDTSYTGSVAYTVRTYQELQVATATSDGVISMGGVTTADIVFIKSDQAISININSNAGTDITVKADRPTVLAGTSITALYVTNTSGSTANIVVDIYGA